MLKTSFWTLTLYSFLAITVLLAKTALLSPASIVKDEEVINQSAVHFFVKYDNEGISLFDLCKRSLWKESFLYKMAFCFYCICRALKVVIKIGCTLLGRYIWQKCFPSQEFVCSTFVTSLILWSCLASTFATEMPPEPEHLSALTEFSTAFSPSQSIRDQQSEFLSPRPEHFFL